jgi:triosephosphate isomerase
VEADKVDLAAELLELAKRRDVRFLLPVDNLESQEFSATATPRTTGLLSPDHGITEGWEALDIGPETIKLFEAEIAEAKTILWNGPLGVFEMEPFAKGTRAIGGDDHRRRGLGDRGQAVWPRGQDDVLLHRWRRFARAAGRQGTAGRGRAEREVIPACRAMRKKIIAANWKMNMTVGEAETFLEKFLREVGEEKRVDIVLAPPFTALASVSQRLSSERNVKLGAQNMHWEMSGAYTGEISASMLRELFVRYIILGHSERRTLFGETDATVNKKLMTALDASLEPIVCLGETLEERDAGRVEEVLARQVRESLAGVTAAELGKMVVAYEPVWAIGTGRNATPAQAQEAHAFIRKQLAALTDQAAADKVQIQYGGSVKPANVEALMQQPDIDGALVGGASLDPRGFAEIVMATAELQR